MKRSDNLIMHVTSLEISKKLKELGVKQESIFYWLEDIESVNIKDRAILYYGHIKNIETQYSAFTASELGLMLPNECGTTRDWDFGFTVWSYEKKENGEAFINHYHDSDTEANCRGKMVIDLIENNFIKP